MKSNKQKNELKHIAFIMDGNGRWAQKRFLPRSAGHSEGVKRAKEVILYLKERNIPFVSLYTFSKENWKRSFEEVSFLMDLILQHFKNDRDFYIKNRIRILHIGDKEGLSRELVDAINQVEFDTKDFDGITVLLNFNYSGKYDIIQAVKRILQNVLNNNEEKSKNVAELTISNVDGFIDGFINEETFSKFLLTSGIPDPDLIVRTSNEFRISNYYLWQASYSEFILLDKFWPDINENDIDFIIDTYNNRDRRFGGV